MKKLLIIFISLFSFSLLTSQSFALLPCLPTGIKDNCYGTLTSQKGGKYEGEFKDNKKNGKKISD